MAQWSGQRRKVRQKYTAALAQLADAAGYALTGSEQADVALLCFFVLQPHRQEEAGGYTPAGVGWGGKGADTAFPKRQRWTSDELVGAAPSGSAPSGLDVMCDRFEAEVRHKALEHFPVRICRVRFCDTFLCVKTSVGSDTAALLQAAPNSGAAYLLWLEDDGMGSEPESLPESLPEAEVDAEVEGRPVLIGGLPMAWAGAAPRLACFACWKESDGRPIYSLQPPTPPAPVASGQPEQGTSGQPLAPAEARAAFADLGTEWAAAAGLGAATSWAIRCVGGGYAPADPKANVKVLIKQLRRAQQH